jgi:hypothetical protein
MLPDPNELRTGRLAPPLVLAAWLDTPALPKMLRLAKHIKWAEKHGALGPVLKFLRQLREEEWFHFGD